MSDQIEVRLRSAGASIGITTDGTQLLVEGKPLVGSQLATIMPNIAGDKALVATHLGQTGGFGIGIPMGTTRMRHVATKNCADIRLMYSQAFANESPGTNAVRVKAGIETLSPVTTLSAGLSTAAAVTSLTVNSLGAALLSGVPITITSGTRSQVFTTSAGAAIGATTISVSSLTPNFAYPANSVVSYPTVYPVSFAGKAYGIVDLNSSVLSDPVGIDLVVGQVFWTRTYISTPIWTVAGQGPYIATNAISNIGDQVLTSATYIPNFETGQIITIDQGGSAELAVVGAPAVTGTGPWTYRFAAVLTKGHASGAVFGQMVPTNVTLYSDLGEGFTNDTDLAWLPTTIAPTAAASSGTISAGTNIGDTVVQSASMIPGSSFTIDTAGALENITVRTMQGVSSPFRYYLQSPLAQAHSSGVALVSSLCAVAGYGPTAIVADRLIVGDRPRSVCIMASDSIAGGTGHSRNNTSFATIALDAAQIPFVNSSKSGEAVYQWVNPLTSLLRRKVTTLGTWALIQGSTNDIYGGRTLAQLQADIQYACLIAKNRGLKVAIVTCAPRSTSSDLWVTAANQTISGAGTNRAPYNQWLRAWQTNGLQGTYVDALFDVCTAIEVNAAGVLTLDAGLWIANGNGPYTADGIHPSPSGHALMATVIPTTSFA